jgi:hypothetical protein
MVNIEIIIQYYNKDIFPRDQLFCECQMLSQPKSVVHQQAAKAAPQREL